jgi:microcystin-dependent protein
MKLKLPFLFLLNFLLLVISANAQTPQAFAYQAAVRNAAGQVLANLPVKVRFSILDSTANGTAVFKETHSTTTTASGMINLNVGLGTPITGNLADINWGTNAKFLQVEIDTTAIGNNYSLIGIQQLMSVPFALFSGGITGSILTFAGEKIPFGYLICDGSELSRNLYSNLFKVIGTIWGAGDGSSTFNIPDLRGQFLRGVSGTSSIDPDASDRISKKNGGNIGNNIGSYQNDELKSHNHTISNLGTSNGCGQLISPYTNYGCNPTSSNYTGGNETRPKNANVYYIIKY